MLAVDIRVVGSSVQAGPPRQLFGMQNPGSPHVSYHRYAVSADGQRFLIPQPGGGPNVPGGALADQLSTFADQGGNTAVGSPVTIVVNWPRLLKKK